MRAENPASAGTTASGANLTLGTRPFSRHTRESGYPGPAPGLNRGPLTPSRRHLDPRLRGGDEEEKTGIICLIQTTSRG